MTKTIKRTTEHRTEIAQDKRTRFQYVDELLEARVADAIGNVDAAMNRFRREGSNMTDFINAAVLDGRDVRNGDAK